MLRLDFKKKLRLHTLPNNQLTQPASITDTTAVWCHEMTASETNISPLLTAEVDEESTNISPLLAAEDSALVCTHWIFSSILECNPMKLQIIDTTLTSIFCKIPAFCTIVFNNFSSVGIALVMVFSWTTEAEKIKSF